MQLTPAGQFIVPYEVMASQQLAVSFGEVGDHIALGEVEGALLRLDIHPFLGVSRSDLPEVGLIRKDGNIGRI